MANKDHLQVRGLINRVLSLSKLTSTFFLLLFLSLSQQAFAQSIENRYRSHIDSQGTTYFICPKQIGNTVLIKKFLYDMTYHTSKDSVILNFTIFSQRPIKVKQLTLTCGPKNYMGEELKTLYADIVGKNYEIRTTSRFSMKDMCEVFKQTDALHFQMTMEDGVKASAAYSSSKWKKDAHLISRIFDLIYFQR